MKLHIFLAWTLKILWGTRGKTTKLHCFAVYAPLIHTPCNRNGHHGQKIKKHLILVSIKKKLWGNRVKTTKLHCICVYALYIDSPCKWKRSSETKGQNTKLHLFLAGTRGKATKLHCFVCMCYILMILIKEEVVMYISRITETTPLLSLTIK